MGSKACSSCAEVKLLSEFPKAQSCADGHRTYCKKCHLVRHGNWRRKNAEHVAAKSKEWVANNPEKRAATTKRCNDKYIASGAASAGKRRRRLLNPDRCRAEVSMRRRKLREAQPAWADTSQIKAIYIQANKKGLTVDHVIPITHLLVCGLHVAENLQLLTLSENSRKRNTFMGIKTYTKGKKK